MILGPCRLHGVGDFFCLRSIFPAKGNALQPKQLPGESFHAPLLCHREMQCLDDRRLIVTEQRFPNFTDLPENAGLRVYLPTDAFFKGLSHPHTPVATALGAVQEVMLIIFLSCTTNTNWNQAVKIMPKSMFIERTEINSKPC